MSSAHTSVRDAVPASVLRIVPYSAGKTIEQTCGELGIDHPVKLSSNENPLGTGKLALAALTAPANYHPHMYPDAAAVNLRTAISTRLGVAAELITCGNGSNEILEMAATLTLWPGRKTIMSEHSFVVYRLATLARGAEPIIVPAKAFGHDLEAMANACTQDDVGVVFVANPNNPTGSWHPPEAIHAFLAQVPAHVLAVLDEAYLEYAEEEPGASLAWLNEFPNLLITRTFSKLHGLAGLRIGYGLAAAELSDLLNRVRQPFNASAPAQAAAAAALNDDEFISRSRASNAEGMRQLQEGLANLGYPTMVSQANFIACHTTDADAAFTALLQAGLIVRQIAEYGLPDWLRITVGTASINERLLAALPRR